MSPLAVAIPGCQKDNAPPQHIKMPFTVSDRDEGAARKKISCSLIVNEGKSQ